MNPRPGTYVHTKSGKKYRVLGVGHHSETLEELVIYQALYSSKDFGRSALWARPASMFLETVSIEGKSEPRFKRLVAKSKVKKGSRNKKK